MVHFFENEYKQREELDILNPMNSHNPRISTVLIWSGNYQTLVAWYKEKLQFPVVEELDHPNDTGTLFNVGGVYLWIGQHSRVSGPNQDGPRHMFNISVDSVSGAYADLKQQGVEFIAEPFESPTEKDFYFATFKDPEGNLMQIVGDK
jgi:catechol 2,3-dioxygenase-like lactoylglutathione lyase family enzyme